jgi:hypothetical protein
MIIIVAFDRPSVTLISQMSSTRCGIEIKTQTLIFLLFSLTVLETDE